MTDKRLLKILNNKFGHHGYKNMLQKEAVETIYKGNKDVCIYMPSGFGKSLCYQLPIVAKDKVFAIVITPSIAHAKNQVDYLKSKDVKAYMWNAYSSKIWIQNNIIRNMHSRSPAMKLLYLTAEQFTTSHFQFLLANLNPNVLAYFVVDEAHCVSPQSHDYKESYENLKIMKKRYPFVPIVAITATANDMVKKDITDILCMNKKIIFSMPISRSNLYYDAYCLDNIVNPIDHLKQFIEKSLRFKDESISKDKRNCGIIFCQNYDTADNLTNRLLSFGISVLTYSKKFKIKKRYEVQNLWTSGEVKVLVTTSCFGTGISKQSVRFVVHWGTPLSIGHYYQETGRAGHDGLTSFCRIYHNFNELNLRYNFIQNEPDSDCLSKKTFKKIIEQSFSQMKQSFQIVECRHVTICKYFDEAVSVCNNHCDICKNRFNVEKSIMPIDKTDKIDCFKRNDKNSVIIKNEIECIVLSDDDVNDNVVLSESEMINIDSSQSVIRKEQKAVCTCNVQICMNSDTQLQILRKLLYHKINNESMINKNNNCIVLMDSNYSEKKVATDSHTYQSCDVDMVCKHNKLNAESQLEILKQKLYKVNSKTKQKKEEYIVLSDSDNSIILLE